MDQPPHEDERHPSALEGRLGHVFGQRRLLRQALVHRSAAHESSRPLETNERLEFLGDAVLDLVVAEMLLAAAPGRPEGDLSRWRAQLVSARFLAQMASRLDIGSHLVLGRGEAESGGRTRRSILADACEALIGAIYLDAGLSEAARVIHSLWAADVDRCVRSAGVDPKSALQERLQGRGEPAPVYEVIEATGPDHERVYTVTVRAGRGVLGRGCGSSKQEAERAAASDALRARGGA